MCRKALQYYTLNYYTFYYGYGKYSKADNIRSTMYVGSM